MKALKFFFLACLLTIGGQAFSQNGANPYAKSTHTYTVNSGAAGTYEWSVLMANGTGATDGVDYTMTGGTTAAATITWLKANVPATNANYIVQVKETATLGSCATLRQYSVTVIDNSFFLIAGADGTECHDENGNILTEGETKATVVAFDVTIDATTFALPVDSWNFDFTLGLGNAAYTITEVKVDGVVVPDYDDISVDGGKNTVPILVTLSGPVTTGEIVTLTVSGGEIVIGTATTLDNDSGDKVQVLTINPLPATTNITTD